MDDTTSFNKLSAEENEFTRGRDNGIDDFVIGGDDEERKEMTEETSSQAAAMEKTPVLPKGAAAAAVSIRGTGEEDTKPLLPDREAQEVIQTAAVASLSNLPPMDMKFGDNVSSVIPVEAVTPTRTPDIHDPLDVFSSIEVTSNTSFGGARDAIDEITKNGLDEPPLPDYDDSYAILSSATDKTEIHEAGSIEEARILRSESERGSQKEPAAQEEGVGASTSYQTTGISSETIPAEKLSVEGKNGESQSLLNAGSDESAGPDHEGGPEQRFADGNHTLSSRLEDEENADVGHEQVPSINSLDDRTTRLNESTEPKYFKPILGETDNVQITDNAMIIEYDDDAASNRSLYRTLQLFPAQAKHGSTDGSHDIDDASVKAEKAASESAAREPDVNEEPGFDEDANDDDQSSDGQEKAGVYGSSRDEDICMEKITQERANDDEENVSGGSQQETSLRGIMHPSVHGGAAENSLVPEGAASDFSRAESRKSVPAAKEMTQKKKTRPKEESGLRVETFQEVAEPNAKMSAKQSFSGRLRTTLRSDLESYTDSENDITVSVVTWNLAEDSPSEEDAAFIRRFRTSGGSRQKGSDIVLISGQECENIKPRRTEGHRSREFRRLMIKMLGKQYVPIAMHSLGGIQFGLFCKRTILRDLEHVSVGDVTCGIGNVFHNKGAIAAFVQLKARSVNGTLPTNRSRSLRMLFVTAHMAAHVKNFEARDSDFWRIVTELEAQAPPRFLPSSGSISENLSGGSLLLQEMDRIFFCGDLNYRIDLPREKADNLIHRMENLLAQEPDNLDAKRQVDVIRLKMLRHDQLLCSMAEDRAFPGFAEGKITFPPTFKFDKLSDDYDTSHKQRIPAWTDRVLFKPFGTRVLEYDSIRNARHSDHRPVYASFRVNMVGKEIRNVVRRKRSFQPKK